MLKIKPMDALKHYMWRTNPELAILKFIKGNVAFSVSDNLGRVIFANNRFCDITGYSENELFGAVNRLFIAKNRKDPFYKNLWSTIESGQVWKGILSNKTKNGELLSLETTIIPIIDNDGTIESYVSMYLDVTKTNIEYHKPSKQQYV